MKKSVFAIFISLGLALPAAVASADPVAESYERDIDRVLSIVSQAVYAQRERYFYESDPVRASFYRDLYRDLTITTPAVYAQRAVSYIDLIEGDPVRASYLRDIYRVDPLTIVEVMEARGSTYHWMH
jgi:hypothetical protein